MERTPKNCHKIPEYLYTMQKRLDELHERNPALVQMALRETLPREWAEENHLDITWRRERPSAGRGNNASFCFFSLRVELLPGHPYYRYIGAGTMTAGTTEPMLVVRYSTAEDGMLPHWEVQFISLQALRFYADTTIEDIVLSICENNIIPGVKAREVEAKHLLSCVERYGLDTVEGIVASYLSLERSFGTAAQLARVASPFSLKAFTTNDKAELAAFAASHPLCGVEPPAGDPEKAPCLYENDPAAMLTEEERNFHMGVAAGLIVWGSLCLIPNMVERLGGNERTIQQATQAFFAEVNGIVEAGKLQDIKDFYFALTWHERNLEQRDGEQVLLDTATLLEAILGVVPVWFDPEGSKCDIGCMNQEEALHAWKEVTTAFEHSPATKKADKLHLTLVYYVTGRGHRLTDLISLRPTMEQVRGVSNLDSAPVPAIEG